MAFELLQKPVGTLDLLLHLLRRGKESVTAIISETGMNKESFYGAADRLKALGYAYEDKQTGYPTYVYWGLTRAGEECARALGPAAEVISKTAAALEREFAELEEAAAPSTTPRRLEILALLTDREFALGRWDTAEAYAQSLVDLARTGNDVTREMRGRLGLGRVYQRRDRHDDAHRELNEVIHLATASGPDDVAGEAEYLIGSDLERQGKWQEALQRFASSADRARRADDPIRVGRANQATARIMAREGRLEEALSLLREAAAVFERGGAEDDLPKAYIALGSTAHSLFRREEAAGWFAKAIEAARRVGDIRMEAYGHVYGAAQLIDTGQYRKADAALARAGQVFQDLGERTGVGAFELNTGQLYSVQGRWSEAEAHFDRALAIARETANRFQEAWVLFSKGMMMKQRDRKPEARHLLSEAKRIYGEVGSEARAGRCEEELQSLTG